jgi:hypothetical protein
LILWRAKVRWDTRSYYSGVCRWPIWRLWSACCLLVARLYRRDSMTTLNMSRRITG